MLCRRIASALRRIVYRSPSAAFRIAEPVEHKQQMSACAGEVSIPGGTFLIAMGRPDRHGIHGEHDGPGRMPRVHPINPLPRQIGRCGEVLVTGKELCLQSPHPAVARGLPGYGAPADNPSHRGIASRAGGIVYVLMAGHVRQAERVIKLAAGRLSGVGGDSGTVDSSFRRRSKSSRRGPSTGSSAGFAICRAPKCAQDIFSYDGTDDQSHQSMEPYGKCGVRPSCRYASPAMLLLARCSCLLKVETRSRRPILLCVRETQHNDGLQGKFDPAERMAGFILNFLRWRRA